MREIEVKARVKNMDNLLKKAQAMNITFGDPIVQDDTTYETDLSKDDPNWNIFRIRKQLGVNTLTMKYRASSRSRDNHERETVIEDPKEVADMLERVGYKVSVKIKKVRRIVKYNGIELCLDEVDSLGSFIEAEKLTSDHADVDSIQSDLWNLLSKLGVEDSERVHQGYDTLMQELKK